MTLGAQIAWDDTVLPFQLDRSDIRGRVVRLDGVLDAILSQHNYPDPVEQLIAEMALLTAMIGHTMKLRWKLSLQVRGDGPARLIATDYFAPGVEGDPARVRAYASFDRERSLAGQPFNLIGKGYFAVLIDQGEGTAPYQGITPIDGGSLSACAETYFAQSEQLPTRFHLRYGRSLDAGGKAGSWRAGGMMLQLMPKASPLLKPAEGGASRLLKPSDMLDDENKEHWNRANILLDTAEDLELVGPTIQPTDLLVRLFHEEGPRVFDPQTVKFGCTCSEDRVRDSLSIYSAKDIATMTTPEGRVTADCQFCGAHYNLDPVTLGFEAKDGDD